MVCVWFFERPGGGSELLARQAEANRPTGLPNWGRGADDALNGGGDGVLSWASDVLDRQTGDLGQPGQVQRLMRYARCYGTASPGTVAPVYGVPGLELDLVCTRLHSLDSALTAIYRLFSNGRCWGWERSAAAQCSV